MKIRWNDDFSVGNEKIDNEHKTFVALVGQLSDAIETQRDLATIKRMLTELELYARFHFFSEETLMLDNDFPGYEAHRRQHVKLLADFGVRARKFAEDPSTGNDLILFLFGWFAEHTTEKDLELSRFLA